MKPTTGNPTLISLIFFNDGLVIHIVQSFLLSVSLPSGCTVMLGSEE